MQKTLGPRRQPRGVVITQVAPAPCGTGALARLSEEFPERGIAGPKPGAPACVTIHLHVDNADQTIDRALAAGATLETPPRDQFYGERSGCIRDPFGHRWNIGHHLQPVTPAEMQRRYSELTQTK